MKHKFDIPDVVIQAALSNTQTTNLTDAILALLGVESIKRCVDITCQKEFIFQDPRPPSGKKPRKDALFCSDICARRTVQRAYVRRKRAKAKNEARGET